MVVEGLSGLWLLYVDFSTIMLLNVLFFVIIGLSTFLFQVPIHLKLAISASAELINKLIRTNWIRTVSWTIRAGILFWMLFM